MVGVGFEGGRTTLGGTMGGGMGGDGFVGVFDDGFFEVEISKFIYRLGMQIPHLFDIFLESRTLFLQFVPLYRNSDDTLVFLFYRIFYMLHTVFHLLERLLLFIQLYPQCLRCILLRTILLDYLLGDIFILHQLPVHFFLLFHDLCLFFNILMHFVVNFV